MHNKFDEKTVTTNLHSQTEKFTERFEAFESFLQTHGKSAPQLCFVEAWAALRKNPVQLNEENNV